MNQFLLTITNTFPIRPPRNYYRRVIGALVILITIILPASAQTDVSYLRGATQLEDILPPSPESSSRVKYADVPFTHSLGMAEYSVPLWDLRGRILNLPLSLEYHSGGIRMDEIAGVAGLGWTLEAGGCITREVVYMPDEFERLSEPFYRMPTSSELSALSTNPAPQSGAGLTLLQDILYNRRDCSPDRYRYSVCGLSGTFIMDENFTPVHLTGPGVSLTYERSSDTFTLKGPDGTVYVLGGNDVSGHTAREVSTRRDPPIYGETPTSGQEVDWEAVTAWYLTGVTSRDGTETATFTYDDGGRWNRNIKGKSWQMSVSPNSSGQYEESGVSLSSSEVKSEHQVCLLKGISLSGYTVTFSYASGTGSVSHRMPSGETAPSNHPWRLSEVSVKHGSTVLARYVVNTARDSHDGRIVLNGVDVYRGNDLDDRWTFTYCKSSTLTYYQQQGVHHFSQDWYGYYNGECEPEVLPVTLLSRSNLCPYELVSTSGGHVPELSHGVPDGRRTSYMSLKSADHDGALTSWTYEGNKLAVGSGITVGGIPVDSVSVGVRVKEILVSDVDRRVRARRFHYSTPSISGPLLPEVGMYLSVSVQEVDMGTNFGGLPTGTKYNYSYSLHESALGPGSTISGTTVAYGEVTEDTFAPSSSPYIHIQLGSDIPILIPTSPISRDVYKYNVNPIWKSYTDHSSSFPSGWTSAYNPPCALDPMDGLRMGCYDEIGDRTALLIRHERYAHNGTTFSLVESEDLTYETPTSGSVMVDYHVEQVMHLMLYGSENGDEMLHYPVYGPVTYSSNPVRTVKVGYHPSGSDTTVVTSTYVPRGTLSKPVRLSSQSQTEAGMTRTLSYTYADTWPGGPSWTTTLTNQHALSLPLKRSLSYSRRTAGGGTEPLGTRKEERMEYGMTGVNGVQRLLLQSHKEYTAGVESWSETVLGRDPLGNVSGVKERGRPSTVILWGYKGLYPVAVVENASVSAVTTALGAGVVSAMASASSPTTAQMNAVANLRSVLPAAHVTTYAWSPGKGVTSMTDPAGVKTTYERDGAGRLTCVKDAAGHAVEGWTYDLLNDGGDGHLSVRHRTYRSESGTQYSEDVRWWNTLGLVEEDVSIGASGQMSVSGINDDLVTAYEGDWMLHDDVKAWLPYPVSGTGGSYQANASQAAAGHHGDTLAYAYKHYEASSRDRVLGTARPGYAGVHEATLSDDTRSGFPRLVWQDGTGVVTEGTYASWEVVGTHAVDEDGRSVEEVKDHAGRLLGTIRGTSASTYYVYDRGDCLRAVAGSGTSLTDTLNMWRYSYDALDRVSSKGIPGSIRESYGYDDEDRIVSIHRGSVLLENEYDAFGRVTAVYRTVGSGTGELLEEHFYDSYPTAASDLMQAAVGSGGWSGPAKGLETYARIAELDGDGAVSGMTRTLYLYDEKERLVKTLSEDPEDCLLTEETTYSFSGEPLSVVTSYAHDGVTDALSRTMTYDGRGRLTGSGSSLSVGSSGGGTPSTATGSTQYTYDALGRLSGTSVTTPGGKTLTTADTYTLRDELSTRTVSKDNATLFTESLTYDGTSGITGVSPSYTGLITRRQETWSFPGIAPTTATEGFTYDYAGRLTRSGSASSPVTYTYDARGNLLTAGTDAYAYTGDRLASMTRSGIGTVSFTHDVLGRMTADGHSGTSIEYNHLDLPRKIIGNGGISVEYSYLSDGSKSKAERSDGTGLVYRGSLTYRKAANGSLTLEGADVPEGRLTPNGLRMYVTDHLGSVRAVVDGATGNLYTAKDYEAYGTSSMNATGSSYLTTAPTGETFRQGFTGQEDQGPDFSLPYTDYGARQYSPALRRWLVPDPMSEKYYGISPYAYCAGNPVNYTDPSGEDWKDFLRGLLVGFITNIIPGAATRRDIEEIRDLHDYNAGLKTADAISLTIAFGMVAGGESGEATGASMVVAGSAATATLVAAPEGVTIAGAGAITIGGSTIVKAAGSALFASALSNADSGYSHGTATETPSKTLWKSKDKSEGRIDVEVVKNRESQIHYQEKGNKNKYIYKDNAFYGKDPITGKYNKKAPKRINDLLNRDDVKQAISKGKRYSGEE